MEVHATSRDAEGVLVNVRVVQSVANTARSRSFFSKFKLASIILSRQTQVQQAPLLGPREQQGFPSKYSRTTASSSWSSTLLSRSTEVLGFIRGARASNRNLCGFSNQRGLPHAKLWERSFKSQHLISNCYRCRLCPAKEIASRSEHSKAIETTDLLQKIKIFTVLGYV